MTSDHNVRRAALALHAAAPADRAWLMEQLPHEQRPAMESMLSELAGLGIPRTPDVIRSVLCERSLLEHADPEALANLLEGEPASLVAEVLRSVPLANRHAIASRLSVAARTRAEVELARSGDPHGDSEFHRAIVEELSQRISRKPRRSAWKRVLLRLAGSVSS